MKTKADGQIAEIYRLAHSITVVDSYIMHFVFTLWHAIFPEKFEKKEGLFADCLHRLATIARTK